MSDTTYIITLSRDERVWLSELIEEKKLFYEKELGYVIGDDREWYLQLLPMAERVEQVFDTMFVRRPDRQFTYWVVENDGEKRRVPGVVNYACIRDVDDPTKQGFMDWTGDITEAVRFARQVDAERFANVYFWSDRNEIVCREHQDVPTFTDQQLPHTGLIGPPRVRRMANMMDEGEDV